MLKKDKGRKAPASSEEWAGDRERVLRYLPDYLADRKGAFGLYAVTCATFITVCCLFRMEELFRLLYAFLLVTFFWVCAGFWDAYRYVIKRRKLALALHNLEQAAQLFAQDAFQAEPRGDEGKIPQAAQPVMEKAYEELICALCREQSRFLSEEERLKTERNDYYLLWAHQIKTPIAAMKLLLNGRDDGMPLTKELFKIEQYVEMVLHYLRLESMSSDLLLKEYDLYDMVRQTVKKFSVLFIDSRLSLKLEEFHVTVLTDEKWLCFVLEQVLSNSIKYTRTGGISVYMEPGRERTLVIADTGIGIRSEDLPRIFERGFTGYNGRMDRKSTGIGLYLCKQVMDRLAHGFRVESAAGKGSRVYLELER